MLQTEYNGFDILNKVGAIVFLCAIWIENAWPESRLHCGPLHYSVVGHLYLNSSECVCECVTVRTFYAFMHNGQANVYNSNINGFPYVAICGPFVAKRGRQSLMVSREVEEGGVRAGHHGAVSMIEKRALAKLQPQAQSIANCGPRLKLHAILYAVTCHCTSIVVRFTLKVVVVVVLVTLVVVFVRVSLLQLRNLF